MDPKLHNNQLIETIPANYLPLETLSRYLEQTCRDLQRLGARLQRPADIWSKPAENCRNLKQAQQRPIEIWSRPARTCRDLQRPGKTCRDLEQACRDLEMA